MTDIQEENNGRVMSSQSSDIIYSEFIHIIPEHETGLCHKLYQQWQDGSHCDLRISVKGGELHAHACIVAAFSPKLKVLLDSSTQSSSPSTEISIQLTFELTVIRCLLNMMYTGVLSFNTVMLPSVMSTARWLQMNEVVRLCQEFMNVTGDSNGEAMLTDDAVLCEVDSENVKTEQTVSSLDNNADLQTLSSQGASLGNNADSQTLSSQGASLDNNADLQTLSSQGALECVPVQIEPSQNLNRTEDLGNNSKASQLNSKQPSKASRKRTNSPRSSRRVKEKVKIQATSAKQKKKEAASLKTEEVTKDNPAETTEGDLQIMEKVAISVPEGAPSTDSDKISEEFEARANATKPSKYIKKCNTRRYQHAREKGRSRKQSTTPAAPNPGESVTATSHKDKTSLSKDPSLPSAGQLENSFVTESDPDEVDFAMGKTKSINCKRCLYKFTSIDEYFHHVADHPTFSCDICVMKYYRKSNLTRHMRTNHSSLYHLCCKKCEFFAKTENSLRAHFRANHKDSKPFECEQPGCTYSAWKFHFLNKHSEIHSEVKHYMCNKCGQGFAQYAGLMSHQRTCFHLQQYLCDLCGQSFNHIQSMRAHRRSIHLGEKPYLCKTCGNQFSDQRNLKRHMLIHDNKFPFQCPICRQKYRHSNSLKAHLKKHGDASVDLNLVGIAKNAQQGQQKKKAGAYRRSAAAHETADSVETAEQRSEIGEVYLSEASATFSQNGDGVILQGQVVQSDKPLVAGEAMNLDSKTSLQCDTQLLEQLSSVADSSGASITTIIPVIVTDPSISSGLGVQTIDIAQVENLTEESFLRVPSVSGASSSKLNPLNDVETVGVYNVEIVSGTSASVKCSTQESVMKLEQVEEGEEFCSDKKLKGQSSYGLQTLAEICFNSSS